MEERSELDLGSAGASARREGERRRTNRERRKRQKHPRLGGALLKLQGQPQHERVWREGGEAEAAVAHSLAERCPDGVIVLHDRRIPGRRMNIDHLAVTPNGVWVIDTKNHKGKVKVRKPLFGKAKLLIRGRDCSKLADGLAQQVAVVAAVVGDDARVRGAFCFTRADLPVFRTLKFRDYPLLYRKRLAKRLGAEGPLNGEDVQKMAELLAERFPTA